MTAAERRVYAAVAKRADSHCEACFRPCFAEDGHRDHFWGRRNGTTVEGVWLLCPPCDHDKTNNRPSARVWVERFMTHAALHGYAAEIEKCQTRLAVLLAKGLANP